MQRSSTGKIASPFVSALSFPNSVWERTYLRNSVALFPIARDQRASQEQRPSTIHAPTNSASAPAMPPVRASRDCCADIQVSAASSDRSRWIVDEPFLPDLMSALALVSRAEEFQLIQQPIATFKLKLTENLVSREFLEVRHSAR